MKYQRIDIQHMVDHEGHRVVKMGIKLSEYHGQWWFECKNCDWTTEGAPKIVGDSIKMEYLRTSQNQR